MAICSDRIEGINQGGGEERVPEDSSISVEEGRGVTGEGKESLRKRIY